MTQAAARKAPMSSTTGTRLFVSANTGTMWNPLIVVTVRTQNHVWFPTKGQAKGHQIKVALTGEHEIRASWKGLPECVDINFINIIDP